MLSNALLNSAARLDFDFIALDKFLKTPIRTTSKNKLIIKLLCILNELSSKFI